MTFSCGWPQTLSLFNLSSPPAANSRLFSWLPIQHMADPARLLTPLEPCSSLSTPTDTTQISFDSVPVLLYLIHAIILDYVAAVNQLHY